MLPLAGISRDASLLSPSKTAANCEEIGRVGKLEADFQQVLLVKVFFSQYWRETSTIKNQQRKRKKIFS